MKRAPKIKPEAICFIVPDVPPSVNHYIKHTRRGRHYVSREALSFKKLVGISSVGMKIRWHSYGVLIEIYLGPKQKGDLDNFPKCVLDGLKENGVIDSDAKVTKLILSKARDNDNPRTYIEIWPR